MKPAIEIMGQGFVQLRRHAVPLFENAVVIFVLLMVLDVFLPVQINIENREDLPYGEYQDQLQTVAQNALIRTLPLLIASTVFLVFSHRSILLPNQKTQRWFKLRFGKVELLFILYGTTLSIFAYVIPYWLFGRIMFSSLVPTELMLTFSLHFMAPTLFVVGALISYRFVLVAPALVLGVAKPLRHGLTISRGHNVTLLAILIIPGILEMLIWRGLQIVYEPLSVDVNDLNLIQAVLTNSFYLVVTAYAAMLLSLAYLHVTSDGGALEETETP